MILIPFRSRIWDLVTSIQPNSSIYSSHPGFGAVTGFGNRLLWQCQEYYWAHEWHLILALELEPVRSNERQTANVLIPSVSPLDHLVNCCTCAAWSLTPLLSEGNLLWTATERVCLRDIDTFRDIFIDEELPLLDLGPSQTEPPVWLPAAALFVLTVTSVGTVLGRYGVTHI